MATPANLNLAVQVVTNGPNLEANITVDYDIVWSKFDQESDQPYTELVKLVGDDSGITPAEDGADDAIPGGQLFPVLILPPTPFPPIPLPVITTISSGGSASTHRSFSKTLPLSALDEDKSPVPNPDEIRAQVTLTPVLPATVVRESNQVTLNIS